MSRALRFVIALWALPVLAAEPDSLRVSRLVVAEANEARDHAGVDSLVPDAKLVRAAQAFADYLAKHDKLDHDADGRTPMQRATAAGYKWCRVAENIAYEFKTRGFESEELAHVLVRDWMASKGHRRNLLDARLKETGVGVAQSPHTRRWYAVQMFGLARGEKGCR